VKRPENSNRQWSRLGSQSIRLLKALDTSVLTIFLSLGQVLSRMTIGKTFLYDLMKDPITPFPPPIHIRRRSVWVVSEVEAYMRKAIDKQRGQRLMMTGLGATGDIENRGLIGWDWPLAARPLQQSQCPFPAISGNRWRASGRSLPCHSLISLAALDP